MRYGQIRQYDVANGVGVRVSVFVTGCDFNCYNCFNKEYQDFDYGTKWTDKTTNSVINKINNPHVSGLTLLGGEPMLQLPELTSVVIEINKHINKDIWIYSGFTFEYITSHPQMLELLAQCDVLVDGQYIESKKNLNLKFRGSTNQRIIDIQKSLECGTVVLYKL